MNRSLRPILLAPALRVRQGRRMKGSSGTRYLLKGFPLRCPHCGGELFSAQPVPRENDLLGGAGADEQLALFCQGCGRAKSYLAGMVSEWGDEKFPPRAPLI